MATLTQLALDADGTIASEVRHDAGTGTPFYTHCNDGPDGLSADYVENDDSESTTTAWFSLANVDSDFGSMDALNIDVDVQATGFSNDSCTLTARIYDADDSTTNPLTAESGNLGTQADSTRVQRNVVFGTLAGTKAQWDTAHIRLTWTYSKQAGPDNANLQIYGCDIDGTYTVASTDLTVACSTEVLTLTENISTVNRGRGVSCGTETLSVTGNTATVNRSRLVTGITESLTLTENSATVDRERGVSCPTETLGLTGLSATISRGANLVVSCLTEVLSFVSNSVTVARGAAHAAYQARRNIARKRRIKSAARRR